jgi:hypothetical protein
MTDAAPFITFRVSVDAAASPQAIYDLLADPRTHLEWAGKEAPKKNFRLLSMDAPPGPLTVGDTFSSTGANVTGTFHDTSTVVAADRGARFGFDTESTVVRKHVQAWHARFAHRYTLEATPQGTMITYTAEVRPQNYVPWWLRPGMRSMTRRQVPRMMRTHLENLATMATSAQTSGR